MAAINGRIPHTCFALPILKVRPGHAVTVVLAGSPIVTFATHWIGGRSLLCLSDRGDCPGCQYGEARGVSYVAASQETDKGLRGVLIEGTPTMLGDLYDALDCEPQGHVVELSRAACKRPLRFRIIGERHTFACGLSDPFRVFAALAILYKMPAFLRTYTVDEWLGITAAARRRLLEAAVDRSA